MNPVSFGEEPEIFGWILSPLTTNVCLSPIVHEKFLHDISPVVVAFRGNLGDSKASFVESKRK